MAGEHKHELDPKTKSYIEENVALQMASVMQQISSSMSFMMERQAIVMTPERADEILSRFSMARGVETTVAGRGQRALDRIDRLKTHRNPEVRQAAEMLERTWERESAE